ncbi:DUF928 domain-containing protein [Nostoc sp. CHAB 5844]|nr:DUF928 domain-containing protein [Nostoc sp. CHAB 5844]
MQQVIKNIFNLKLNCRECQEKDILKGLDVSLIAIASLSLLLFFMPVAIAAFKPTNRQPASDYSRSAGKRGCPNQSSQGIPLTLLAPQTYVGYTTSLRPTFVGFISNPQKVELRIFEFSSDNKVTQIGNTITKEVKSGIFKIPLPEENPDLIVGKKYLWLLAIDCSGSKIFEAAEFVVTEISSTLKSKLLRTNDSSQKVDIYAEESLWYEALTEALKLTNPGKLGKIGATLVKDLAEYESPRPQDKEDAVKKRVQNLQAIAIQDQ